MYGKGYVSMLPIQQFIAVFYDCEILGQKVNVFWINVVFMLVESPRFSFLIVECTYPCYPVLEK